MNSLILILLIGLSATIGKTVAFYMDNGLERILEKRISLIPVSNGHRLKLSENGKLSGNGNPDTVIWEGVYDNQTVAVKLTLLASDHALELNAYKALNAMNDPNIEKKGIAKVYCHGSFESWTNETIYFIAMTKFDEHLQARFKKQKGNISDLSLSLIFRRSAEILENIHSKNVLHNDIKPENIFLRGSEVFIGDFDLSSFKGVMSRRSTARFGSLKFHKKYQRTSIDDLQSLVFSIWEMAGCHPNEPYGLILLNSIKIEKLTSEIQKNCKHFTDENIQKTFESICEEIIRKPVPQYGVINRTLTAAIDQLIQKTGQKHFEWLSGASSSQS